MSALAFDTLKFTKTLKNAGFGMEQAEAVAVAFRDASGDAELATKKDIALAVAELKTEMAGVRGEMGGIRGEMTTMRWMLGFLVALAVANFAKQYF
jgi:hypothetical protein